MGLTDPCDEELDQTGYPVGKPVFKSNFSGQPATPEPGWKGIDVNRKQLTTAGKEHMKTFECLTLMGIMSLRSGWGTTFSAVLTGGKFFL
jgi:hypothetical protein